MTTGRRATVLKLGGELVEPVAGLPQLAAAIGRMAADGPLVVVHGGGREVDAALARQGLAKRSVDGLRITGDAELPTVVAILAGLVNTRLVAALASAGVRAVGLTGADDRLGLVRPAPPRRMADGTAVSLGLVGEPIEAAAPELLSVLCDLGCVPVVASIGMDAAGALYNVNADTFAASLAGRLGARQLVVAGGTAGVLDGRGRPLDQVDGREIDELIAGGAVQGGMVAKLMACRAALAAGVAEVAVVDGRLPGGIEERRGTRVVAAPVPAASGGREKDLPCS
jgi:acetylglutamate kinase